MTSNKLKDNNWRSQCAVSRMLEIVGDKWTMLVVRDLFFDKKRYGDFLSSPEKIPTNILANRLNRLLEYDLIIKKPYQNNPVRYEYSLTKKGKDLGLILSAMAKWGKKHVPGSITMDEIEL